MHTKDFEDIVTLNQVSEQLAHMVIHGVSPTPLKALKALCLMEQGLS